MTDAEPGIISAERAAIDRWIAGDTRGLAELCDPAVTYFDSTLDRRLDGLPAVAAHFAALSAEIEEMLKQRGKTRMDRHEMLDPVLETTPDMAVLSYGWAGHLDQDVSRWRATSVYRRREGRWRIIHMHWSAVSAPAPAE